MKKIIVSALFALTAALAQDAAPVDTREVVGMVGTSYNQQGSPKATLTLGGYYQIADSAYVGVAVDVAFKPNTQPGFTVRPEYIRQVFSINGQPFYAIGGIGASFVASDPTAVLAQLTPILQNVGTNVGYSAATGLTTTFKVYKGLYAAPVVRVVKGSLNDTQVVAGINFGGKLKFSRKR